MSKEPPAAYVRRILTEANQDVAEHPFDFASEEAIAAIERIATTLTPMLLQYGTDVMWTCFVECNGAASWAMQCNRRRLSVMVDRTGTVLTVLRLDERLKGVEQPITFDQVPDLARWCAEGVDP